MINALMSRINSLRQQFADEKRIEAKTLKALKDMTEWQLYDHAKSKRLAISKEVKSSEDELRNALIESGAIDGDNRHPAVKAVTRKTLYDYQPGEAVQYAMENGLVHCLGIDKSKFDSFLSHLAESDAPLPEFVEAGETVSVALKSDLSDIVGGDA